LENGGAECPRLFINRMPSSSSSRRSERNVRLDPMGIYGTRSERRRLQLQRRRQVQNVVLWLLGILALGFGGWWLFQPHPTSLHTDWSAALPFRPAGAPVVTESGALLLPSQSGGLWAMSQADPSHQPQRLFATAFAPSAPPLVVSSSIFWPGGDGVLRALDLSGKQRWARALPSALVGRPGLARTKSRPVVAVGDDEGHIGAFDAVSGAPLWRRSLGGGVGEEVVSSGGTTPVFIVPMLAGATSGGGLICLDAATGTPRWRFPAKSSDQGPGIAAPAVSQGRVYWCNDEGTVIALDVATGRKVWKTFVKPHLPGSQAKEEAKNFLMLRGAPVVVLNEGIVAVGGNDGLLRAFDIDTGTERWTLDLGGPALFAAQRLSFEGRDVLLATGSAPGIYLLEAATGRVVRHWATPYGTEMGVATTGSTALALDAEGHLQGAALR
jgi:outer membrane protein assembly factor BamB